MDTRECASCSELRVVRPIRSPGDLRKAIRVVGANLDDGTLIELPGGQSFETLRSGDYRPDLIHHEFRCASCGSSFTLTAETYHGSGGAWKPV